jgi:predicted Ser/Thr protein kinase/phage FluMu protein Com
MPQVISCPKCRQKMQVPDGSTGKQVKCPTCKVIFVVGAAPAPTPTRQPVAAAAPAAVRPAPAPTPRPAPPPPAPASAATPKECPACKSPLLEGAIACMDCGYLLQPDASATDSEGPPNLCSNPACGVANPPGERTCQRCGNPLPTPAGTVLHNRYRVEKLLAMGGFGAVYLAADSKNGNRQVAIKDMICPDPQEFAIRLNFFRREAEILRTLEQLPVVPRIYDLIEQGQTAHLVMEFIRGQDLLKIMEANSNKPFPADQVVDWGKSICDVLSVMHTQSPPVVHRDLKPDNIMLLDDGRSIKLIDFGTARDLGRTAKDRAAAKTKVYTEGYAPPEQIIGKPEPRSDLFALAGTLYHLLTGKSPEGFYTARELESQLADGSAQWPPDHRWLFELIKINLSEDVKDRYFSAREIKADLEKRQVTREVSCPKCHHANTVREPYCARCAEPLTDPAPPCHNCGKPNRMGSRYCIHCGNHLR